MSRRIRFLPPSLRSVYEPSTTTSAPRFDLSRASVFFASVSSAGRERSCLTLATSSPDRRRRSRSGAAGRFWQAERMNEPTFFNRLILRAALRQAIPMAIRLLSVSDRMELSEFHRMIRLVLGWKNDLGYIVRVHGQRWCGSLLRMYSSVTEFSSSSTKERLFPFRAIVGLSDSRVLWSSVMPVCSPLGSTYRGAPDLV